MKSVPLTAFPRMQTRRAANKQLRAAGRIPAVIYGQQTKTQSLEINAKEIVDLIHHSASENLLVDLAVKDDSQPQRLALVQEIQHHPLSGRVLHVDFHEVSATEKVTIMVPVETVGEAVGVKMGGGVLEHVLFKLKVRALPKDLPDQLIVDVTKLELGKSIHIGEIPVAEGVEIIGNKTSPVVSVAMPRTEEEETATAEAAVGTAGDVEMIKEKKEEGEEVAPTKGTVPTKGAAPAKGAVPEKGAATPAEKPAEKKK